MINELDTVALLIDRPDLKLRKGEMGTVVDVLGKGEAFQVEFVDDEGYTYGFETFAPGELLKLHHRAKAA
ncbi:MAG: DUF4926 domain-containing protein [Caulobacter sp.]